MSLTVLEGNTFFVCDDDGNAADGSEGLYSNDVRYVSLWRMTLDDLPPKLLGTGAQGHFRAASYGYKAAYARPRRARGRDAARASSSPPARSRRSSRSPTTATSR